MDNDGITTLLGLSLLFSILMMMLGNCIGEKKGMQIEACKPYTMIETLHDNRVVCEMPDGGIEIRTY